jgi:aminopeptidase N
MTERYGALAALVQSDAPSASRRWRPSTSATGRRPGARQVVPAAGRRLALVDPAPATLEQVQALMANPAFSLSNPNKVYAPCWVATSRPTRPSSTARMGPATPSGPSR